MCIIVVKPVGVAMPPKEVLARCAIYNPDGMGFMYTMPGKGKVRIRKGFFAFEDFWQAVSSVSGLRDVSLVMHFRISTQGGVDAANCHPFPISTDPRVLSAKDSVASVALVHNGYIPLTMESFGTYRAGTKEPYSDTFLFVRDYAALVLSNVKYHENRGIVALMEKLADSKLAILGHDGHIELVGRFIEDNGIMYSNDTYLPVNPTKYGTYSGTLWDDGDDMEVAFHSAAGGYSGWRGNRGSEWSWDAAKQDFTETLIDNTDPNRQVLIDGQFIPQSWAREGVFVIEGESGMMLEVDSEQFVYDRGGNVYRYDDETGSVRYLSGFEVVGDDFVPKRADECDPIKFVLDIAGSVGR